MRVGLADLPYMPEGETVIGTEDLEDLFGVRARSIELRLLADDTVPKLPGRAARHYYLLSDAARVANTLKDSA
jgi:hypothetical protein